MSGCCFSPAISSRGAQEDHRAVPSKAPSWVPKSDDEPTNAKFYVPTTNSAFCADDATIHFPPASGLNMWSGALSPPGALNAREEPPSHRQQTEVPSSRRSQDPPDTPIGPGLQLQTIVDDAGQSELIYTQYCKKSWTATQILFTEHANETIEEVEHPLFLNCWVLKSRLEATPRKNSCLQWPPLWQNIFLRRISNLVHRPSENGRLHGAVQLLAQICKGYLDTTQRFQNVQLIEASPGLCDWHCWCQTASTFDNP